MIAFLLMIIVSLCSINVYPIEAEASENANPEFKVTGASIRFINDSTEVEGIRFGVAIREDIYNTLSDDQKANYRLLVMPTQLANGRLEIDELYAYKAGATTKTTRPLDLAIDWSRTENRDGYEIAHVVLHGIGKSYYTVDLTARAYYQEGDDEPIYSEAIERSYARVATAALDDPRALTLYDEVARNALLGVKYIKTGTWDYQNGILMTDGAEKTHTGTSLQPLIIDRTEQIRSKQAVIEASYYVGVSDPSAFVGQPDGTDLAIKGLVFGYDTTTKAQMILDFRYRSDVGSAINTPGWYPYLRAYKGTDAGWGAVIGKGSPLAEGWYDFRISVDTTKGYAEVIVEYKEKTDSHYTTMINSYGNQNWAADNNQIVGTGVGFYSTISGQTLKFDSDIKVYNDTVQTRGKHSQKVAGELNADGTGTISGSLVLDYRTTGGRDKHEGISFGGDTGEEGYTFFASAQANSNRFYVGMWKWNSESQAWDNAGMSLVQKGSDGTSGAASIPGYSKITEAGLDFQENDEFLLEYDIEITLQNNERVFDISYWISYQDGAEETLIHQCTDWKVKDTANSYNGKNIYLDIYVDGMYQQTIKCEQIKTIPLQNSYYHFDIYYKYENGFIDGVKESLDFTYN